MVNSLKKIIWNLIKLKMEYLQTLDGKYAPLEVCLNFENVCLFTKYQVCVTIKEMTSLQLNNSKKNPQEFT